MWGLGGQGVELFDWGEAFSSILPDQLAFLQHMRELDAGQRALGRVKRFEAEHGTGDPLHAAMILFDDVIQIFHLAEDNRGPVLRIIASDGGRIGLAAIDGDRLAHPMAADCPGEKPLGCLLIPLRREEKVNRLAVLVAA